MKAQALKYVSWGDTTGYAVAGKSYIRALIDAGVDVTWTPMLTKRGDYEVYEGTDWPCAHLAPVCNRELEYDTILIHTVPEYYPDWIERERVLSKRIYGYTVWELERLPDHWPAILNRLDGVLVPCEWNREVFNRSGVTVPIHVVPHLSQFVGASPVSDADRATIRQHLSSIDDHADRFVFYSVAYWSHRKAPYLALQAYWRAFGPNDRTLMILKTTAKDITRFHRHWRNGFRLRHPLAKESVRELRMQMPDRAPVVVIADESLSDQEMMALHERGDCFVSLTRTEGWGLGAFEAARTGKPVIMTGYGGQLDFLDPALSCLVDYEMVPVYEPTCYEPTWAANYRPADQWAQPSVNHASKLMREVFDDAVSARARAIQQAQNIQTRFSQEKVVSALIKALEL